MGKTEKKFNKRLIGAIIGSAVIGGLSMTPKGKSFWKSYKKRRRKGVSFMRRGWKGLCKSLSRQ